MEDQYQQPQPSVSIVDNPVPSQPVKQKKGGLKWLLIVILLLAIAGIAGFFLTQSESDEDLPTPTPFVEDSFPTEEPQSTSTPKPIDKEDISIEIQNGTGVAGEAGFLQKELEKLGYKDIEVGNASTQDATTTTVTFATAVDEDVKDEITTALKSLYKSVETKTSSTLKTSDILIVTGTRKGATASSTPKASGTPRPTSSPRASASPTVRPTATPQ